MIYFICSENYHVKIGRSDDVDKRFRNLNSSNGGSLWLKFTIDAENYVEQKLHQYFSKYRIYDVINEQSKEWFFVAGELEEFLYSDEKDMFLTGILNERIWPEDIYEPEDDYDFLYKESSNSEINVIPYKSFSEARKASNDDLLEKHLLMTEHKLSKAQKRKGLSNNEKQISVKLRTRVLAREDVISKSIALFTWQQEAAHIKRMKEQSEDLLYWEREWWFNQRRKEL